MYVPQRMRRVRKTELERGTWQIAHVHGLSMWGGQERGD